MYNENIFRRCGTFLDGKDLKGGLVGVGLDFDGAAGGVVEAEGGGEREEPGFGVVG